MNRKSYTFMALVLLVLVFAAGAAIVAGESSDQPELPAAAINAPRAEIGISVGDHTASVNGQQFAMNPTMLPAAPAAVHQAAVGASFAMNSTMLPVELWVPEKPAGSGTMSPTMLPVEVTERSNYDYAMNTTMLPADLLAR